MPDQQRGEIPKEVERKLRPMRPSIFKPDALENVGTQPKDSDFFVRSISGNIPEEFADLDSIIKTMHDFVPDVQTEQLYIVEVDTKLNVFKFLMLMGALITLSVLVTIY